MHDARPAGGRRGRTRAPRARRHRAPPAAADGRGRAGRAGTRRGRSKASSEVRYGNRIARIDKSRYETDADAIARSLLGSRQAFELVFERHFAAVFRYLRRRVGAFAEDLAAETFTRAFAGRARLRPGAPGRPAAGCSASPPTSCAPTTATPTCRSRSRRARGRDLRRRRPPRRRRRRWPATRRRAARATDRAARGAAARRRGRTDVRGDRGGARHPRRHRPLAHEPSPRRARARHEETR